MIDQKHAIATLEQQVVDLLELDHLILAEFTLVAKFGEQISMLLVDFLVQKALTCSHLHINLDLVKSTEEVLKLVLLALDYTGAHHGPKTLHLSK